MLRAEQITKSYPTRAGALDVLRDASLAIEPGTSCAILGPSGSGKSTLLNILGMLEPPTAGRYTLDDDEPWRLPEPALARFRNRRIGFVFQEHHLLPQCTALENVLLPALAGHLDATAARAAPARAAALLARVGLADRQQHRPAELSGGERQRVAIARALLNRPRLVLADEPTGNLDAASAAQVGALLGELPRQEAMMLVVVTHSPALAACCDCRRVLADGRLVPQ